MKYCAVIGCIIMFAGPAAIAGDSTPGVISTIAGNGTQGLSGDGGPATSAQLNEIAGIAVDSAGNLYIADPNANQIRKVSPDGVIITVVGWAAGLNPRDVALDAADNLYVADYENCRVVKVTPAGAVSTLASKMCFPLAIASDPAGNVYVATMSFWDIGSDAVHKVSPDGTVSEISGGLGDSSSSLDVDSAGNVYAAGSSSVWKVDPQGGLTRLPFYEEATDVAVDRAGNIFVADCWGSRIRMLSPAGIVTTVAGNGTQGFSGDGGPAPSAQLKYPTSVAVDKLGNILVGDFGNHRIRKITRWIDYYNISGMPYNGEDVSFWFNFAESVWYSGSKAGEISLVGACPPWQKCGATGVEATPTQVNGLTGAVALTDGAALRSDGTVWILNPTYADRTTVVGLTPKQVAGLTDIVAVTGNGPGGIALKRFNKTGGIS